MTDTIADTGSKLGHDYVHHDAKAPTCTEVGWEAYDTCSRCDYTTYVEIPKLGHEWSDEWTVDVEATYDHAGSKSHHCKNCEEKTDVTEIPKLVNTAAVYSDVKEKSWFRDAVDYAVTNGLMNGTSADKFNPNGTITREQMAAILYRFSEYKKYDTSARGSIKGFPDAGKVHSYAEDALSWAVGEGLIGGVAKNGKSYLDPRGSATRAQVATILQRFCEKH